MNIEELIDKQKDIPFEQRLSSFKNRNIKTFTFSKDKTKDIDEALNTILSRLKITKVILGKIAKKINGGFLVKFNNYEGFLPYSQCSIFPSFKNLDLLLETYCELEIVNFSVEPFVIIFSRKSLQINPIDESKKQKFLIDMIIKFIQNNNINLVSPHSEVLEIIQKSNRDYYKTKNFYPDGDLTFLDEIHDYKNLNRVSSYQTEDRFCSSCQEAPCMCSDPEESGTI